MIIDSKFKKKLFIGVFIAAVCFFIFQFYIPKSFSQKPEAAFTIQKGKGSAEIAKELKEQGFIKSNIFFRLYAMVSNKSFKLQAGIYNLSPSMSIASIVKKIATGNVIKNTITIIEGWDAQDIAKYLEVKNIVLEKDFLDAVKKDWSQEYAFFKDKPKTLNIEGYIFPDTYQIARGQSPEEILKTILSHFDKKLTAELRNEIASQKKSIFQIITMASMIEKEVQTSEDKKIVSGILWKRNAQGMPLQVDATVNYVTGKHDRGVSISDTKIDSPYNTYKYYGLPKGPISNPGMDSIEAATYPTESPYWYYISANGTGETIFSKTLEEHNAAVAKYLKP